MKADLEHLTEPNPTLISNIEPYFSSVCAVSFIVGAYNALRWYSRDQQPPPCPGTTLVPLTDSIRYGVVDGYVRLETRGIEISKHGLRKDGTINSGSEDSEGPRGERGEMSRDENPLSNMPEKSFRGFNIHPSQGERRRFDIAHGQQTLGREWDSGCSRRW